MVCVKAVSGDILILPKSLIMIGKNSRIDEGFYVTVLSVDKYGDNKIFVEIDKEEFNRLVKLFGGV